MMTLHIHIYRYTCCKLKWDSSYIWNEIVVILMDDDNDSNSSSTGARIRDEKTTIKLVDCSRIFDVRKTDDGFCCSFNSLEQSSNFDL